MEMQAPLSECVGRADFVGLAKKFFKPHHLIGEWANALLVLFPIREQFHEEHAL
jgi:hypothetical protein